MSAKPLHVRPYRREDLGSTVRLWEQLGIVPSGPDRVSVDEAIDAMLEDDVHVFVAEADGDLLGVAFGTASGPLGTIHRVTVDPDRAPEAVEQLLVALERSLAEAGARTVSAWVAEQDPAAASLRDRGFEACDGLVALRRPLSPSLTGTALGELGGRMIDRGLWDELEGMEDAKRIIERRVILPLAEPDQAGRHGVAQPKAIVLFGPPGTGKTTFAKGIASRLRWPFVELAPAALTGGEESRALTETFDAILELDAAVVFVDEVEDIASARQEGRRVDTKVTNEFLKQIPRFREAPNRLLVCATNHVGQLDPAFIRPGRFDYVLPVGPPDEAARAAIWRRYVRQISDEDVDIDALVQASALFTPADIEFAARKAAQIAFENEHFGETDHRARTEDFITAIRELRPTVDQETVEAFERDVDELGRF